MVKKREFEQTVDLKPAINLSGNEELVWLNVLSSD